MKKESLQQLIEQIVQEEIENDTLFLKEGDDVIYKAFIQPFKDIADTAVHGVKSVATKAGSDLVKNLKMHLAAHLTWLGPEELKNIEKKADDRLKQYTQNLDAEYKDVLQRNFDALSSTDVAGFTFFLRPDLFFARKLTTGTPAAALEFLDTVTLGNPKVRALKQKVQDFHQTKDFGSTWKSGGGGLGYVDYDIGDGGLEEARKPNPQAKIKNAVENLLKDPDVIASMKKNPTIKAIAQTQVNAVLDRATELAKVKTFEDVKNFAGNDASELEKRTLEMIPDGVDLTDEQKTQLLDAQVPEFKKLYKEIFKSYITNLLNLDNFYPEETKKALEKINQI